MMVSSILIRLVSLFFTLGFAQFKVNESSAFKVVDQKEGLLILTFPAQKQSYSNSPFLVFVRMNKVDFEIIARGKVEVIQDRQILVSLDRSSIIKYPITGDLAVPLGNPKDWPKDSEFQEIGQISHIKEDDEKMDPGFLQLDFGRLYGNLSTISSDGRTNEYKDVPQFEMSYTHFLWYVEFLWRLGLEYESYGGTFPTSTYYRSSGPSTEKATSIILNYRFHKIWFNETLRPTLKIISISSQFTSLNADEALLSTSVSGYGVGNRWSFELDSNVWDNNQKTGMKMQQFYIDFSYFPMISNIDSGQIKRGNSFSNSHITEYRFGFTTLFYLNFIPFIKRYTLEMGYTERNYNLKFQGPTKSETNGNYEIPENLSENSKTQWYFISLGVRFDDFIGKFFKPR